MPFKKKATRGFPHDGFDQADRKNEPNKKPAYGERKDVSKFKQSKHPFLSVQKARDLRKAEREQDIHQVAWILLSGTLREIANGVTPTLGHNFVRTATQQLIKLQDMEAAYAKKLKKKLDALGDPDEEDAELDAWMDDDSEQYDDE